jgi:hypothetical protein
MSFFFALYLRMSSHAVTKLLASRWENGYWESCSGGNFLYERVAEQVIASRVAPYVEPPIDNARSASKSCSLCRAARWQRSGRVTNGRVISASKLPGERVARQVTIESLEVLLHKSNSPAAKLVRPSQYQQQERERGDIYFPGLMLLYTDCIVYHYIYYICYVL